MLAATAVPHLAVGLCAPPLASELLAIAASCCVFTASATASGDGCRKRYRHCEPEMRMNYDVVLTLNNVMVCSDSTHRANAL
jgi:hypothetical protein